MFSAEHGIGKYTCYICATDSTSPCFRNVGGASVFCLSLDKTQLITKSVYQIYIRFIDLRTYNV